MARVTVEDCLKHVENRFQLVLIATRRARQLTLGAAAKVEENRDKPTVIALREIAEGLIGPEILKEPAPSEEEWIDEHTLFGPPPAATDDDEDEDDDEDLDGSDEDALRALSAANDESAESTDGSAAGDSDTPAPESAPADAPDAAGGVEPGATTPEPSGDTDEEPATEHPESPPR